jgi:large subunit ribosomal protein L14
LQVKQLPGIPRFDTSNVVLIEENGNPTGTRIHAPIPNCIRPTLVKNTHPKKADYTKLLAIATKFV